MVVTKKQSAQIFPKTNRGYRVSGDKKCSFFGKCGMLYGLFSKPDYGFLRHPYTWTSTTILRFDEYYRRIFSVKSEVPPTHEFNGTTWL